MGKLGIWYAYLYEDKSLTNEMQSLKWKVLFWFNSQ